MCRLLAYAAPRPTTAADVLGPAQSSRFQQMARLHQDGWGTMWLDAQGALRRERVAETGHDSELLAATLGHAIASARVVHLRMATDHMAIDPRNTHPFQHGSIGLAHNGSIVPVDALRGMLTPQSLAGVEGSTDSELYFALLRQHVDTGLSVPDALATTVAEVRAAYPRASLNAMVLTPTELCVVRSSPQAPVPWDDFVASGLADDELPLGHTDAYFRMMYRRDPDGTVVVSSAGLETTGWTELPEDTVATVALEDLRLDLRPVFAGQRASGAP